MNIMPLISVIIPTYNRAQLIGETLDSIIAQTYQYWECIVIDDGSSDHTDQIMRDYCKKDNRIKYYHRPKEHLPGGNGARNFGFNKSNGDYIIWFDSDDLMTNYHIETKVKLISSGNYDFGITRTKFANRDSKVLDRFYNFKNEDIDVNNYIIQKINWFTLDVIIKKDIAEKIRFNEFLKSGQEYNYFCRLTYLTHNATFLNEVITYRRFHENSISTTINTGKARFVSRILTKWISYQETKPKLQKQITKKVLLVIYKEIIKLKSVPSSINKLKISFEFLKIFKFQFVYMILYFFSVKFTNRLYFLRKLAINE